MIAPLFFIIQTLNYYFLIKVYSDSKPGVNNIRLFSLHHEANEQCSLYACI